MSRFSARAFLGSGLDTPLVDREGAEGHHGPMSDQGPGDHGSEIEPETDTFGDGSLDVPNCPSCLHAMDPTSTPAGGVYWACTNCGQTRLA